MLCSVDNLGGLLFLMEKRRRGSKREGRQQWFGEEDGTELGGVEGEEECSPMY